MKTTKLAVHLGASKQDWDAYAKSRGYTPSALAAILLKNVLLKDEQGAPIFHVENKKEWGATHRVELRLNQSEFDALNSFIETEGTTRQSFIVGLFRAHVASEPQYSTDEFMALRDSNRQLRKVGTNLNELLRKYNRHDAGLSSAELMPLLEQLKSKIDIHTDTVQKTIMPSYHRYQIVRNK